MSRNEIHNNDDWQNKQILILEKLADYTITLTKDEFIPSVSSQNDDTGENDKGASILIPQPGEPLTTPTCTNVVTEDCSICLSSFKVGDRICWSSNETCPHVYHEQCIIQWLIALLTKQKREMLRRNRRNRNNTQDNLNNDNSTPDVELGESTSSTEVESNSTPNIELSLSPQTPPIENTLQESSKLSTLPRACPMCRQNFIVEKCEANRNHNAHEDKCDSSSGSTSDEEMDDDDDQPSVENLNV